MRSQGTGLLDTGVFVVSRRALVRGGLAVGFGAAMGAGAASLPALLEPDRLPLDVGYAPAGNTTGPGGRGVVKTVWRVDTDRPWVALTFDDGPEPDWTPRVLDTLDRLRATVTFFLVGERLQRHGGLVRGRYGPHEVGNHTWSHEDLAMRDAAGVREQLGRCHEVIEREVGRPPVVMRPPWGHAGGTTLTVAGELGYDVVMWSYVMPEQQHESRPAGIVDDVAGGAGPGSILLAHDVGRASRLVVIDNLEAIVNALRAKGLELVTVSQLLAAARVPSGAPPPSAAPAR